MSQNLISLQLTGADYARIDSLLDELDKALAPLIDLTADERRSLARMGDKSEVFCRQTLSVMAQNRKLIPESVSIDEAESDLKHFDALRLRCNRLQQLTGRCEDSVTALGSDVMSTALEGYALLRVLGRGAGLEDLRSGLGARFSRRSASAPKGSPAAAPLGVKG
jgi:hypothetical protein